MGFYSFQAGYTPGMYSKEIPVWTPGMAPTPFIKAFWRAKRFAEEYMLDEIFSIQQRSQFFSIVQSFQDDDTIEGHTETGRLTLDDRLEAFLLLNMTAENADRVIELTKLHNPEWLRAVESRAAKVKKNE